MDINIPNLNPAARVPDKYFISLEVGKIVRHRLTKERVLVVKPDLNQIGSLAKVRLPDYQVVYCETHELEELPVSWLQRLINKIKPKPTIV